jgi:Zn-dependent peptidase ImmA (M78 family)/O-acetyl-ADP-ribose deacetylase (regulator of RNase III)
LVLAARNVMLSLMSSSPANRWTNPSVRRLLESGDAGDPAEFIAAKARDVALKAMEAGWTGPPFDPFELAARLGVSVVARSEVADARLTMAERGPRIEFNPSRRAARVRFSVAHELAHLLFDDFADQVRERHIADPTEGDDWQLEMLCNVAASEFLMPAGAFPQEQADDLSLTHLLDLRTQYGVSTEAVVRRAVRLTDSPAAVVVASREEDGGARIDYITASRGWRPPVESGWKTPTESILRRVTAVGYSVDGHEDWNGHRLHIQVVGVPPYGGHRFPRIIGVLTPDGEDDLVQGAGITYVRGDATTPQISGPTIIAHVVNNEARSWGGRGFAVALARQHPEVHEDYQVWVREGRPSLGSVHWTETRDGLTVASMVAQGGYGTDGRQRLRLGALHQCLQSVAATAREMGASVHMPLVGTGHGGARWDTIRDLILDDLCAAGIPAQVYVLPEATMPADYESQLSLI